MNKIYAALAKIQRELKAPKNLYNSFGKYSYRNAEGILEAVKPLLGDMALIINDEPVMIGERYYIRATVTLTDGNESVSAVAYAREDAEKRGMDGCQLTGACSSYARKYALNALLMIDDSKDSDDDSLSPKNPANETKPIPKATTPAKVTTQAKVPTNKPDAITPQQYIKNEIDRMGEVFEIPDPDKMMAKFLEMRGKLIKSGKIKDVKSKDQTMEQAKALIDAIYKHFTPSGEFKEDVA